MNVNYEKKKQQTTTTATQRTKKITKINKSCTKDLKEKHLMVFVAVAANVYANVLKTTRNEKNNNNNKNFLWNRTKIACKVFLKKWKKQQQQQQHEQQKLKIKKICVGAEKQNATTCVFGEKLQNCKKNNKSRK